MTKDVYSVSRLNAEVRAILETRFSTIWIEAEISNLIVPASGHMYFSLKDSNAQIRCAMFRNRNSALNFKPENGQQVLAKAKISLYEARGDFQLIVETLEPAGEGALRQAFEALKFKLSAQGLFEKQHKKPLPTIPRAIGLITSATGAAIRDILNILKRRYPIAPILVYPTLVQGEEAADSISQAINSANQHNECDVLILTRGGGSIEDLWAFNNEELAHTIFNSQLPIVTGIGHEIDFTIADFVADYRAPTPSAAAEAISPDCQELGARLALHLKRLTRVAKQSITQSTHNLDWAQKRLQQQHPQNKLQQHIQRVDQLAQRQFTALSTMFALKKSTLSQRKAHLLRFNPLPLIIRKGDSVFNLGNRLEHATLHFLSSLKQRLTTLSRTLDSMSPLATLGRGYAIVQKVDTGKLITKASQTTQGDHVLATLAEGQIECRVTKINRK